MTTAELLFNIQNPDSVLADPYRRIHFLPAMPGSGPHFPWMDSDEVQQNLKDFGLDGLNNPGGDEKPTTQDGELRTLIPIGRDYLAGADAVLEQLERYAKIEPHSREDVHCETGICQQLAIPPPSAAPSSAESPAAAAAAAATTTTEKVPPPESSPPPPPPPLAATSTTSVTNTPAAATDAPPPPDDDWHLKPTATATTVTPEAVEAQEKLAWQQSLLDDPSKVDFLQVMIQESHHESATQALQETAEGKAQSTKKHKKAAKKHKKKKSKKSKKKAKKKAKRKAVVLASSPKPEQPEGDWVSMSAKKQHERDTSSRHESPLPASLPELEVAEKPEATVADAADDAEAEEEAPDGIDPEDSMIVSDSDEDAAFESLEEVYEAVEEFEEEADEVEDIDSSDSADDSDSDRPPEIMDMDANPKKRTLPQRAKRGKKEKLFVEENFGEDLVEDPRSGKLVQATSLAARSKAKGRGRRAPAAKLQPSAFSQLAPGLLLSSSTKRAAPSAAAAPQPKRSRVYESKPLAADRLFNTFRLKRDSIYTTPAYTEFRKLWENALFHEAHALLGEQVPPLPHKSNFARSVHESAKSIVCPESTEDYDAVDLRLLRLQRIAWTFQRLTILDRQDGIMELHYTHPHKDQEFFPEHDIILYTEKEREDPLVVMHFAMNPTLVCSRAAETLLREIQKLKHSQLKTARALFEYAQKNRKFIDKAYLRWANSAMLAEFDIF